VNKCFLDDLVSPVVPGEIGSATNGRRIEVLILRGKPIYHSPPWNGVGDEASSMLENSEQTAGSELNIETETMRQWIVHQQVPVQMIDSMVAGDMEDPEIRAANHVGRDLVLLPGSGDGRRKPPSEHQPTVPIFSNDTDKYSG
jgi:hypothetical protein